MIVTIGVFARRLAPLCLAIGMLTGSAPAHAATAAPSEVSGAEISMLVRSTLVALHHANLTGNYTVLRDLGGIHFQAIFSASALADRFRTFRDRDINLGPAVLFDAQLDVEPILTNEGLLRVLGHFPTQPQQVIFDVTYRFELGRWRIEDLNVGLRQAVATIQPRPVLSSNQTPTTLPASDAAPVPASRPANR